MKRFFASALLLSAVSGFGLVGCGDTSEVKKTEEVSGPGGKTVTEAKTTVKSTGENPPANSAGETGSSAAPK